jgi:hypothetical protein
VHHVGAFPRLEDQMCAFTIDFDRKEMDYSPDRVDALVWALIEVAAERRLFLGKLANLLRLQPRLSAHIHHSNEEHIEYLFCK